jgi:hypothetical protein
MNIGVVSPDHNNITDYMVYAVGVHPQAALPPTGYMVAIDR